MKKSLVLTGILLAGATLGQNGAPPPLPFMMMIPALEDGATLPLKYSCSNAPSGMSPRIQWLNTPRGTQSFALLLHDPEAHPAKSAVDYAHWLIFNIPGRATELAQALPNESALPDGSQQLKRANNGTPGYFGPCAPPGVDHHYTFELYALDTRLQLGPDATRVEAMKAMDGHILGTAVFVTLFHRQQ